MLESVYETCLAHELRKTGHRCETQVALPVPYDGLQLEAGYRIDLLVDDLVIVEIKSVEEGASRLPCSADHLSEVEQEKLGVAD
jgi:GxxExxY protein